MRDLCFVLSTDSASNWSVDGVFRHYGPAHWSGAAMWAKFEERRAANKITYPMLPVATHIMLICEVGEDWKTKATVMKRFDLRVSDPAPKSDKKVLPRLYLSNLNIEAEAAQAFEIAISETILRELSARELLLDIEVWRKRYPARALIDDNYAAFNTAYEAAKAAGEKLIWEPRFGLWMERPAGVTLPYDFTHDGNDHLVWDVKKCSEVFRSRSEDFALSICRSMNTGFSLDEANLLYSGDE